MSETAVCESIWLKTKKYTVSLTTEKKRNDRNVVLLEQNYISVVLSVHTGWPKKVSHHQFFL